VILGISSSGKSTLANTLAKEYGIDHIELDHVQWKPNWTMSTKEEFTKALEETLAVAEQRILEGKTKGWVIDGNYRNHRHLIWPKADVAIFLNYSFSVVMFRLWLRTLRRLIFKIPVCNGNIETWTNAFASKESLFVWVWTMHGDLPRMIPQQVSEYKNLNLIQFDSPMECGQWVDKLLNQ
jgi:adenylate kinase family enzyme